MGLRLVEKNVTNTNLGLSGKEDASIIVGKYKLYIALDFIKDLTRLVKKKVLC
jgi:hypothetical protein